MSAPSEVVPGRVYVGNLSWSVDDAALRALFETVGSVAEATVRCDERATSQIVLDRESGRSKGFGFVTFADQSDVQRAIEPMRPPVSAYPGLYPYAMYGTPAGYSGGYPALVPYGAPVAMVSDPRMASYPFVQYGQYYQQPQEVLYYAPAAAAPSTPE